MKDDKRQFPWKAVIAAVICLCLILTAVFAMGMNKDDALNYGQVSYLSGNSRTDPVIYGEPFRYIAGAENSGTGVQAEACPPAFEFQQGYIHVVAKAVAELGTYETMHEYGSVFTNKYRVFTMEVLDPLESELGGTFYYLLPENLKGDLTRYDALLISMMQLPKNFVLRSENALTAFEYLFCDPNDTPELGNMIAFTDGVFDESLWQDESWYFGYQFAKYWLDENGDYLIVSRGSALEEVLERKQKQFEEQDAWAEQAQWGDWTRNARLNHYAFQTEEAQQLMAYLKPFENGVFVPQYGYGRSHYRVHRYINGCHTNEWYAIDCENEEVTSSEYRFEDGDFENLPNLSGYIESLDLTKIAPPHMDPSGKELLYNHAAGWYEKTEEGVYSIVKIAWRYCDQNDSFVQYYDEMFILLDEDGDHLIAREDLIARIGENGNISSQEYGAAIAIPMA